MLGIDIFRTIKCLYIPYATNLEYFNFSAVTLVPAIFKLFQDLQSTESGSLRKKSTLFILVLDGLSIILVIVGLIVWPVTNSSSFSNTPDDMINDWAFPVGAILASFGWWESFVSEKSKLPTTRYLWRVKTKMSDGQTRYVTYLFVTAWKILLFFILFIVFSTTINNISDHSELFNVFPDAMHGMGYYTNGTDIDGNDIPGLEIDPGKNLPWKILATQVCCGLAAYIFGKFACKYNIQQFAFAAPLTLVMPTSIGTIMGLCEVRRGDPCKFTGHVPNHLFFQCPMNYTDPTGNESVPSYVFLDLFGWAWIFIFLAQCWITSHIWIPKSRKLAKTEQMFGTPYYNGLITDQSMMLNRRSDKGQLDFRLDFPMQKSNTNGKSREFDQTRVQIIYK